MSSKRRKRNPRKERNEQQNAERKAQSKKRAIANAVRMIALICTTALVFSVYRFLITKYYFEYVLVAYTLITAAATLTYVIYNRGFSRKGITPEMLPDSMTKEEKEEFIADGERRIRKSRPLFIVVFAFAFTFVYDIIELFAIPQIGRASCRERVLFLV